MTNDTHWHPQGWRPVAYWTEGEEGELRVGLLSEAHQALVSTGYTATGDERHARASWLLVCARAFERGREVG